MHAEIKYIKPELDSLLLYGHLNCRISLLSPIQVPVTSDYA